MNKRKLFSFVSFLFSISLLSTICITLSWFDNKINIDNIHIDGNCDAAPFESGDGSENKPYVISNPRHLYNLAWLQYLGTFNKKNENNDDFEKRYHFELKNDIDVSNTPYKVLPPIGTDSEPFVGYFDGKSYTVKGLTISNSFSDYRSSHPYYVSQDNFTAPKIIGFFGTIGDDSIPYEVSSKLNAVHDLYLDQLTVKNGENNSQILAGFLAGYVNGPLSKSAVYRAKFDFTDGTTNITGEESSPTYEHVSDYSLIGAYNTEKYSWKDMPGSGASLGFGGSINIKLINRRINYITTVSTLNLSGKNEQIDGSQYLKIENAQYHFKGVSLPNDGSQDEEYYWNSSLTGTTKQKNLYIKEDTFLPLSVNNNDMGLNTEEETEISTTINNKNPKYHCNKVYAEKTPETPSSQNTGFIVGGGDEKNPSFRLNIAPLNKIWRSYAANENAAKNPDMRTFSKNLRLITYDYSEADNKKYWKRIQDSENKKENYTNSLTYDFKEATEFGFSQYNNVKRNFINMLGDGRNTHGFGFFNFIKTDSWNQSGAFKTYPGSAQVNDGKTTDEKGNPTLSTYNNYNVVPGTLNFSTPSDGKIALVAGSYFYTESVKDDQNKDNQNKSNLFNLFKVTRDNNGTIKDIEEIKEIYEDDKGKPVLNPTDQEKQDAKEVFSSKVFSEGYLPINCAAYYFEFSLPKGDYIIGSKNGSPYQGAYIMYMDIGANGGGEDEGKDNIISDIDFTYDESAGEDGTALKKFGEDTSTFPFSNTLFQINGKGKNSFFFKRTSSAFLYYVNSTSELKVIPIYTTLAPETKEEAKWE